MPEINKAEMAAEYGLTLSFLNSNKELKRLFDQAVKNTWDPARFQAAVRNTQWYKKTAEPYRQAQVLQKTDPATYRQRLSQVRARVRLMATEFGATLNGKAFDQLAERVFQMGMDDNQVRRQLGQYVKYSDGRLLGQAGQWEQEARQHMQDMGITWNDKTIRRVVSNMVRGDITIQDVISRVNEQAKSKYRHLADRIDQGETVYDIASPYMQEIGEILEINPESITLKNSLIKKALDQRDEKGNSRTMTLSEFGDTLRKDSRWRNTQNAQEVAAQTTRDLLSSMGLIN